MKASFSLALRAGFLLACSAAVTACGSQTEPGVAPAPQSPVTGAPGHGHLLHPHENCTPQYPCPQTEPQPPTGKLYDVKDFGGTQLKNVTSHIILYNPDPTLTDPEPGVTPATIKKFLTDLYASHEFKYIINQYVANAGTYSVDPTVATPASPISWADDQNYNKIYYYDLHAVAAQLVSIAKTRTGPSNLYHVILPSDLYSLCDSTNLPGDCINQPQNFFPLDGSHSEGCAMHYLLGSNGSVIYYTIQHDISMCGSYYSGNSLVDASDANMEFATLAHETFEAITDPQLNAVKEPIDETGDGPEIGDICSSWAYDTGLNGSDYFIQPVWSNADAKCYYDAYLAYWPPISLERHR